MKNRILWVGIAFDPDNPEPSEYYRQQRAIVAQTVKLPGSLTIAEFPVHAVVFQDTGLNEAIFGEGSGKNAACISLCSVADSSTGFGVGVDSVQEGRDMLEQVEAWLRSLGITMFVSVFEINLADEHPKVQPLPREYQIRLPGTVSEPRSA